MTRTSDAIGYVACYVDWETGLYYLQSRYYDPALRRFISADVYMDTGVGILGTNMYIYANNNPVNFVDPTGFAPSHFKTQSKASLAMAPLVPLIAMMPGPLQRPIADAVGEILRETDPSEWVSTVAVVQGNLSELNRLLSVGARSSGGVLTREKIGYYITTGRRYISLDPGNEYYRVTVAQLEQRARNWGIATAVTGTVVTAASIIFSAGASIPLAIAGIYATGTAGIVLLLDNIVWGPTTTAVRTAFDQLFHLNLPNIDTNWVEFLMRGR